MRFIVVLGLPASIACVDPGQKFSAFESRTHVVEPVDASADALGCAVQPGAVAGQYLLAISVTLAPGRPILALTDVTTPALDEGTGLSLDAQPLAAADRLTPVGDRIGGGPFPVSANGSFRADLPGLAVTGAANPVTGGDILADLVLGGSLCGSSRNFCGTVTGNVKEPLPLDLAGSTFTLTRIDAADEPPRRPAIDCAGTLADAL
jgi:hypothetical protein